MPKVNRGKDNEFRNFLTPDNLNIRAGRSEDFEILSPHYDTTVNNKTRIAFKAHAINTDEEGEFTCADMNKNRLYDALGDNSDTWPGALFTANAKSYEIKKDNKETMGWEIIPDSIRHRNPASPAKPQTLTK